MLNFLILTFKVIRSHLCTLRGLWGQYHTGDAECRKNDWNAAKDLERPKLCTNGKLLLMIGLEGKQDIL